MRIGLLADIHGNAHALISVLKSAKEKKIQKLLCCGDYIGYYYEPNKVLSQLNEWDWEGVSGNHEGMLKDWISKTNRTQIQAKYATGIAIAALGVVILDFCNASDNCSTIFSALSKTLESSGKSTGWIKNFSNTH